MKFIRPTAINDARLTSSTVPETDYAVWSSVTTYALAARCISTTTHRSYESVQASNLNHDPTTDTTGTWWLDVGPTNRWAMFDAQVGTETTASDSLTVVLTPGRFNSIALLQVDAATVEISLEVSGQIVYSASMDLTSGNTVGDWYQYFYEPVYQQDALVVTDLVDAALLDLPAYGEGILTVTLTRTGGSVACGVLVVGLYADLGETQYSPTIGIIDYSRKEIDAFGNPTIVQRSYSKKMNATVTVPHASVDNVARLLAQYRSTAVVWVGAGSIYTSMIIYGFYKDWDLQIGNPSVSDLSLQIEGLT